MEQTKEYFKRNAFKAYDIRGKVPDELNEEMAYSVGRAYVELFSAKQVVVGHDIRLSGRALADALIQGLTDAGVRVIDIGLCGTEQVYFATFHLKLDGGIMVTASHNPQEYNGLKMVRAEARPISADTGLKDLEEAVVSGRYIDRPAAGGTVGTVERLNIMEDYIRHLLTYIDQSTLKPLKVVINAGNGSAGPVMDALEKRLPFEFVKVNHTPDGTFPNGVPNPMLLENQEATASVVRREKAALGIAWDGDFDRCFFFDEKGEFIEGYYLVGLLAQAFLAKKPGAKIIHDPRLTWNTIEITEQYGGTAVQNKSGHAFIKERMRKEDAVYGGEMSAHHYFKDFSYCDSGMIPWLLVLEIMCRDNRTLSGLVGACVANFPISGEINSTVENPASVMSEIERLFITADTSVDRTDGLSVEYTDWRFNVRMSNTEPVLRLNVETRGNKQHLEEKTQELLKIIRS